MSNRPPSETYLVAKKRRHKLYILLLIELLILWIIHPTFIPIGFLEKAMTWVQTSILEFLWPQKTSEFFDKSFRYWIYRICTTIGEQPFWPALSVVLPWIIPILIVINYIRCWNMRREKSYTSYVSGADSSYAEQMRAPLEYIQSICELPKSDDLGIWFTRLAGDERTDRVYKWDSNGSILVQFTVAGTEQEVLFKKDSYGDAYCICANNEAFPLEKGKAFSLSYDLDGDEGYQHCVATWLGGYNT